MSEEIGQGDAVASPEAHKIDWQSPFIEIPWSKVALIGYAPSCKLVDWHDPDLCRTGLNDLYRVPGMGGDGADGKGLSYQCWFQMHAEKDYAQRTGGHYQWLTRPKEFPIFMQKKLDKYPSSVEFPIEAAIQEFGDYFTNSISYMLAWAILESAAYRPDGFKEIFMYGIDMATGGEFEEQRPSVEYYIGIARGMGVPVHIPSEADIMKAGKRYGYEGSWEIQTKIRNRRNDLMAKKKQAEIQMENLKAMIYGAEGSIQDCDFWLKNWCWSVNEYQEWADDAIEKHCVAYAAQMDESKEE